MVTNRDAALPIKSEVAAAESDNQIFETLLTMLRLKNPKICAHSYQVANYAVSIAAKMRLPKEEIERIRGAAVLHDVGQLSVPNSIIVKVPYLSTREISLYRSHCNAGAAMLENIEIFVQYIPYILSHHEQWDGIGYPYHFKGKDIPLAARIFSIVDVWDALTNDHSYRKAWSPEMAVEYITNQSGKQFDPEVVSVFLEMLDFDRQKAKNKQQTKPLIVLD
ncbi:MAG: HD domain-containing phosphohydrolase [Chloroflexota bacterium]